MKEFFDTAKSGDLILLKKYLNKNIDINKTDNEGFASIFNRLNIAEELIKNNALINLHTKENWTALIFSSFYGHYDIAEILLKNNADLNIKNKQGFDALLTAVFIKELILLNYY